MTTKSRIYSVGGNKRIKDGQGDPVLGYDVADSAGWIIGTLSSYFFAGEKKINVFQGEWLGAGACRNSPPTWWVTTGSACLAITSPLTSDWSKSEHVTSRADQWDIRKDLLRTFGKVISVQFSLSVVSDSLRPVDCSIPGFPVHHQLLELAQIHVHRVDDAIQPSHPLLGKLFTSWSKVRQGELLFYLEAFTFSLPSSHLWDISSPTCQASGEQPWCLSHSFTPPVPGSVEMNKSWGITDLCNTSRVWIKLFCSWGPQLGPILPHPHPHLGDVWQCLEMFLVAMTGGGDGICWHLVKRGQGCCQVPCNVQGQPHNQEWSNQNINSAQAEKLSSVDKSTIEVSSWLSRWDKYLKANF